MRERPRWPFYAEYAWAFDLLIDRPVRKECAAVASWLIAQGHGPAGKPIAILSDNSLEHALFLFGALRAGALVAPISPNYSLSDDLSRLDHALSLVEPGLVCLPLWRPDPEAPVEERPERFTGFAGVGRKK